MVSNTAINSKPKEPYFRRLGQNIRKHKAAYIMVLPVLAYYIIFCYIPMFGSLMAFQDYEPALGFTGSPWVGFRNFEEFFRSEYCLRIIKNTFVISAADLIFGFPAPIILVLLVNEFRSKTFIKAIQTTTYLPHFISLVVVCAMIKSFLAPSGIIGSVYSMLHGGDSTSMLMKPNYFVPIYVISNIWQGMGWGSIVYFAALSNIDSELYEACKIDGGGKLRQAISVTLPGLLPTIVIMLIMRIGNMLNVGYEKIILLYSPVTYKTADVISSFVYRNGLQNQEWSSGTAIGLFNSVINVIFLLSANMISKKLTETSLW